MGPIVGLPPLIACMLLPSPEPAVLLLLSSAAAAVSRVSEESNDDHHDDDKQAMHDGWLWLWLYGTSTSMLWLLGRSRGSNQDCLLAGFSMGSLPPPN